METYKNCTRCKTQKNSKEFKPCSSTKDKLQVWCNDCRRAYALEKYEENKEKSNCRRREYYKKYKK